MRGTILIALAAMVASVAAGPAQPREAELARYIEPYVQTRNFSGVILIAHKGVPQFARAYGLADQRQNLPNRLDTRFHVASMSMQFTAAAVLRLVQQGRLILSTPLSAILPDYPRGDRITVRNLLTETSGIADINAQPGYPTILKSHQSPRSLVRQVRDLPPLRDPGSFAGEEHSAYNLLALIIELKTGLPFRQAMRKLVFGPLAMKDSGIDDDSAAARAHAAVGYAPDGLSGIAAADRIHWSAKAGNGSAYTTAMDELRFIRGVVEGKFLKPSLRAEMFDLNTRVGYGWFKSNSRRFDQPVYSMNGRAPGFASAMVYIPREQLFVVALSNIYSSAPSDMAEEMAALWLGQPYQALTLQTSVDPHSLAGLPAAFRFPEDFYQPNALVSVAADDGMVTLRWPTGDLSVLVPTGKDHYIDRAYWVPVEVIRDNAGRIAALKYGKFVGKPV